MLYAWIEYKVRIGQKKLNNKKIPGEFLRVFL